MALIDFQGLPQPRCGCGSAANAKVQHLKRTAHGFRNRDRFRNAIMFHLGDLDLYPTGASLTHTTS